jgi:hypothetical protein
MIISYYPGAGGNKYYRRMQNQEWQTFKKGYDVTVIDQFAKNRYPTDQFVTNHSRDETILTHCLNTALLRSVWPNHKITVIIADLQSCLRREWALFGHQRYLSRIKHTGSKLELYRAIKDTHWPEVNCINDLDQLPANIILEVETEWRKNTVNDEDVNPATALKKQYANQIDSAIDEIVWHKNYYQTYPVDIAHADCIVNIAQDRDSFSLHMKHELNSYHNDLFNQCWNTVYV